MLELCVENVSTDFAQCTDELSLYMSISMRFDHKNQIFQQRTLSVLKKVSALWSFPLYRDYFTI